VREYHLSSFSIISLLSFESRKKRERRKEQGWDRQKGCGLKTAYYYYYIIIIITACIGEGDCRRSIGIQSSLLSLSSPHCKEFWNKRTHLNE